MFNCSENLSSLVISNFKTANVKDMSYMFDTCQKLTELNLSNFKTEKVKNMRYMFSYCNKLKKLNLSNFNTANVTNMTCMFINCKELSSLDISNFNTAKVKDMSSMFKNCQVLSSLDLSNFNTTKVTDMSGMFSGCSTLQTIYVSDNFVVTGITDENYKKDLFTGCEALPEYGDAKTSSDYANYKTGYFTKLVVRNGDERYGIKGETTQLTVDNLVLADNKDFVAYDPFKATAASYNRTINNTWATLCLPFEVSLDNQNFRAFELGSVSNNEVVLKELNTIIAAGTPVIIKMNEGETKLNFTEADKEIANEVKTAATADGNYQLKGLYTQKLFDKAADNNCYIVKGDKLMNPAKLMQNTNKETVGSKPFRAYMVDKSTAPAAGAKMFSIGFDNDGTTAIDNLNTIADDNAVYYDLQGKRLNAPQKGINIVKRGNKTM
ncbi:BspA family leucine-rich repeat surface protein, partial [Leyella stercorea]|uniref:BspA family leucine-rich repeat surface protein n=1 Tax=Leyella stercorea TaxID=363265 RepID=UPI003FEEE119